MSNKKIGTGEKAIQVEGRNSRGALITGVGRFASSGIYAPGSK